MLTGSILIDEQKYSLDNLFIINKLFNMTLHTTNETKFMIKKLFCKEIYAF